MTNLTWEQLRKDMMECEQARGQTVYEHGQSVWNWYSTLNEILAYGYNDPINKTLTGKEKFKLPSWWFDYEEDLAWERHNSNIILGYTVNHDCGKPYCKTIDEDGRFHFPNHAKKSYDIWMELMIRHPREYLSHRTYGEEKTKGEVIGDLILHDMDIHTMKAKDIDTLVDKLGSKSVVTLLLVALCEVHSNAEMFGGIDSPSFKMKWKQIDRRGKAICKKIFAKKIDLLIDE